MGSGILLLYFGVKKTVEEAGSDRRREMGPEWMQESFWSISKLLRLVTLGTWNYFLSCCLKCCWAETDASGNDQDVCRKQCIKQMYSPFCLRISCDQTQGFMNMSFQTYQLVGNQDHTSGSGRTARGNCAPAVAGQTRLKRFTTAKSPPKLQSPLSLATQLLLVGPLMHICFVCIAEPRK